jgi:hypothetical protein
VTAGGSTASPAAALPVTRPARCARNRERNQAWYDSMSWQLFAAVQDWETARAIRHVRRIWRDLDKHRRYQRQLFPRRDERVQQFGPVGELLQGQAVIDQAR